MKIFMTLGSQKFQFDRLLKAADALPSGDELFAQTGYSDYQPKNYAYKAFLDRDEFKKVMSGCDIVIAHGGTGAIIGAVKNRKKVIAVPRLARFGEHVDDHQLQIVEAFEHMGLILGCSDPEKLSECIEKVKTQTFREYVSNTQHFMDDIDRYLNETL